MYDWGKKRKMLVFTGVYVCVKAKLTFVSFFFNFFLHLSLSRILLYFHMCVCLSVCDGRDMSIYANIYTDFEH